MKKCEKCDIFSGCQSFFLFFGLNDLFICILKGLGSFLLVANKSGQKWFRGSVQCNEMQCIVDVKDGLLSLASPPASMP